MAVDVDTSSNLPSASYKRVMLSTMSGCGLQRVLTRTPLRAGSARPQWGAGARRLVLWGRLTWRLRR